MRKHEASVRYRHMLDNARKACELMQGKTRASLDEEGIHMLALVRLLEVVGEAAHRMPKEEQSLHPEIPWEQIIGLRNRLIHGYDSIDLDILWQIVSEDLPLLIKSLENILANAE